MNITPGGHVECIEELLGKLSKYRILFLTQRIFKPITKINFSYGGEKNLRGKGFHIF